MTTNTKQSYSESDEVFTGSGRYPWQHIPASFLNKQEPE